MMVYQEDAGLTEHSVEAQMMASLVEAWAAKVEVEVEVGVGVSTGALLREQTRVRPTVP